MRIKILLLALIFNINFAADSAAQELPLVYDVENSGANVPKPYMPALNELPVNQALPNPFLWSDGRGSMINKTDWEYRRNEIGAQIQNYEIGDRPTRPENIEASYANNVLTVKVTVNGKSLTLTSQVNLPEGPGPFPAVIGMNSPSGSISSSALTSRKIAMITYNHNDITTYYGHKNQDPFYLLYPEYNIDNTGQYSPWSWGVSRLIDGLELVQDVLPIDLKHLAVTGCSYAGKMALFAGAFDERIALTISVESGGGGATSWRFSHSEPSGSVEKIDNTDYNWFMNSMKQFSGDKVWQLPEDHHELMAMVAPRALLVTANPDMIWLSSQATYVASKACEKVYDALGISDRFGYTIIGGHGHCAIPQSQTPEIMAFIDKFLLGKDTVNTNVRTHPGYTTNLSTWIPWSTPVLGNGTSYFGRTDLVSPANLAAGLDKSSVTFQWNKVQDAAKYIIQLSTNALFTSDVRSDSTTSDTVKTFTNLLEGKRYFWRVQVKNNASLAGPWSTVKSFTTYVALPAAPELGEPSQYQNRLDYYTLKWNKVNKADQYTIQVSRVETFATVAMPTATTSDTSKTLSGFLEGQKYFWRVQASNVTGSGPWTAAALITKLAAPINLAATNNTANEITLTWTDNTGYNDGYVVEHKQGSQTSFALLDTVKGTAAATYIDKTVQGGTYTYRIKAYNKIAVSDYSNEAELTLTDVKDQVGIPTEFSLSQNYPNPFNPATKIKFGLPQSVLTKLTIYDLLGREVQTLINKELEAGYHEVTFDAGSLQNGVYFYRIQSGNFVNTKKLLLLK